MSHGHIPPKPRYNITSQNGKNSLWPLFFLLGNCGNSDKPPSSDGYKKPQNKRQKTGKPTGGQWGHEGKTLEKVQNPDEVIEYKTPGECDCGCDLHDVKYTKKTRQVFDIPKPKMKVTEHVTYEVVCPKCGKVHKTVSEGTLVNAAYGLYNKLEISVEEIKQQITDSDVAHLM